MISAQDVKKLRDKTGAGMMDCKAALKECSGDIDTAAEYLRKRGIVAAGKKAARSANDGLIHAYIHPNNKVGALIEVNCETDFVARNDEFKSLVKELGLQIAAMSPEYVGRDEVPESITSKEIEIYREQSLNENKPEKVIDGIVKGRLEKFYKTVCLLDQAYVKDDKKTIQDLVTEAIAKTGENIVIRRFVRYALGEEE